MDDLLEVLLRDGAAPVCVEPDGRAITRRPGPGPVLSGAFNPVHAGHWGMADAAARTIRLPAVFELSVENVDKPPLTRAAVRQRLDQFAGLASVWVTRAPTFRAKARLFPGSVFIVGADTAARIIQPRYYQDRVDQMEAALHDIRAHGCRFLVAGRVGDGAAFVTLRELELPSAFRDLFEEIPPEIFRLDLSSTELRAHDQR